MREIVNLNLDGVIEYCEIENYNKIFIKYDLINEIDNEYKIIQSGISNISNSNSNLNNKFSFNTNFNIDIKIYKYVEWPKLVISVFSFDYFNRNILIGTACLYLNFSKGYYDKKINILTEKKSLFQAFCEKIFGNTKEIKNPILLYLNQNNDRFRINTEYLGNLFINYNLNFN